MKLNHLHLIEEGIERIAAVTGTDTAEIIEALTGVAWDEEDAGGIREFMIDALADDSANAKGDSQSPAMTEPKPEPNNDA